MTFSDNAKDKLKDIIETRMMSMTELSRYEDWDDVLDAAGIHWVGSEKKCPTHQFVMVWDPLVRFFDRTSSWPLGASPKKRLLIVPNEIAIKILALGYLP